MKATKPERQRKMLRTTRVAMLVSLLRLAQPGYSIEYQIRFTTAAVLCEFSVMNVYIEQTSSECFTNEQCDVYATG